MCLSHFKKKTCSCYKTELQTKVTEEAIGLPFCLTVPWFPGPLNIIDLTPTPPPRGCWHFPHGKKHVPGPSIPCWAPGIVLTVLPITAPLLPFKHTSTCHKSTGCLASKTCRFSEMIIN